MADDQRAALEGHQGVLEGAQGHQVQVVGRLVQDQDVAADPEQLGQLHPVLLAARHALDGGVGLLVGEEEALEVAAHRDLSVLDGDPLGVAGDLLDHGLLGIEQVAPLVGVNEAGVDPHLDGAGVGLVLPQDHAHEGRLAHPVRPDDPEAHAGRELQVQVRDEGAIAEAFGDALELDDLVAEPLAHGDEQVELAVRVGRRLVDQLLEAVDAGLLFGAAGLGLLADPLQLAPDRHLADVLGLGLGLFALGLEQQVLGVVAHVLGELPEVQLDHAVGHVVEEVAIVGDQDDGPGVGGQVALEPGDGLGVQVVGRLVQHQQVGLGHQGARKRYPAHLAAGEAADGALGVRDSQVLHDARDLDVQVPGVEPVDLGLEALVLGRSRRVLGKLVREGVVACEKGAGLGEARLDALAHGRVGVEDELLVQVADAQPPGAHDLAFIRRLLAREDAHERRLPGAIDAQEAEAVALVNGQADVVEDRAALETVGHAPQREEGLSGEYIHAFRIAWRRMRRAQ
ncbi:hypothetical protein D3C86_1192500 [compost metagenome]